MLPRTLRCGAAQIAMYDMIVPSSSFRLMSEATRGTWRGQRAAGCGHGAYDIQPFWPAVKNRCLFGLGNISHVTNLGQINETARCV